MLALAVYSFVGAQRSSQEGDRLGSRTPRRIACWAAVTIAAFALVLAAFGNDFSVAYILHHSNRDLPIAYKFAALWSGQEGPLLLWAWLLSTYGLVMRLRYKVDPQLRPTRRRSWRRCRCSSCCWSILPRIRSG